MSYQVKIFEGEAAEIETEMNTWFQENPDIQLSQVVQTEPAFLDPDGDIQSMLTITVIYHTCIKEQ